MIDALIPNYLLFCGIGVIFSSGIFYIYNKEKIKENLTNIFNRSTPCSDEIKQEEKTEPSNAHSFILDNLPKIESIPKPLKIEEDYLFKGKIFVELKIQNETVIDNTPPISLENNKRISM